MGARRKPRNPQGGRRTRLLDPGVFDTIIEAITLGVPISIACQGVGVAEQSYRNWLNRGVAEHEEAAEEERDVNPDEALYVEFYLAIQQARTKAAMRNVAVIQKAAQGGSVTEKSIKRYRDHEGNDVEEETLKRTAPDWKAAAWYLERSHRSEYGKDALALEVTGPGGGPIEFRNPEEELANRLSRFIAEGVPTLELLAPSGEGDTNGDVHDAEIVDEF